MASQAIELRKLAPLISVVGTDGAGKSTVNAAMLDLIRQYGPAEACYLGLKSGDIGRRIREFRFGGALFEAYLARKGAQARSKTDRIPGPFTALVIYGLSLFRIARFKRMLHRRREGVAIITDRFPQIEVPGFYDGPGLSAARAEGWFVRWLQHREFRKYTWMASHRPDLIIRLNVSLETAFARKPDHELDQLRSKIAVTPHLIFGGAPICDIDSDRPLEEVLDLARSAIEQKMEQLGRRPQANL